MLPREQWVFRDPSGAGICPICKFPIEVHPLDVHGEDIDRCPDREHEHEWYRPHRKDMPFKVCTRCGAVRQRPEPSDL